MLGFLLQSRLTETGFILWPEIVIKLDKTYETVVLKTSGILNDAQ